MIVSIGNMEKDNIANKVKARDHDTVVLDELQYKSPDFWEGFGQYMRELIQNGMAEPVVKVTSHYNDDAWNRHHSVTIEIPDFDFMDNGEPSDALEMKKRLYDAFCIAREQRDSYDQERQN